MSRLHGSIFLNFLLGKIVLFLLVPLTKASIVDDSYKSYEDVFDAILNTLFPITFIILFNVSETGPIKRVLLPLLDDILYNTIAWVFPLTASLSYLDIYLISYLSPVACFHICHSICAIIKNVRVDDLHNSGTGTQIFNRISFALITSPAILIPEIWIVFISYRLVAGWPKGKRRGIYTVYKVYLTLMIEYLETFWLLQIQ
ncbi:1255_t:CDS:2 [Diversispora eburnea]|uniref:1255_t:CDS:1 n=1 Tax=Diversispora eburnea TaxID=1213867 RepID=A0A9N9A7J2_9GLOM|nr:1255_t:CDS:2 [Diversispora eburnea]